MTSSMLVPGLANHRTPQMSQTLGHTKNMKISQKEGEALSVIEDAITINEQDTVEGFSQNIPDKNHDENVYSDDDTKNKPKSGRAEAENVSEEGQDNTGEAYHLALLTQEDFNREDLATQLLRESITKRASLLAAEEAR